MRTPLVRLLIMAYGLNVTLSELPGGCSSLKRLLNADHDEYDHWFSSSDAERASCQVSHPVLVGETERLPSVVTNSFRLALGAAYVLGRVGDLNTRIRFNHFNSTPSIQFGDVVNQLHGPNAE
jgi:hypothetical protein